MNYSEFVKYDPSSPTFLTNTKTRGSRAVEGQPAGKRNVHGFELRINYKVLRSARVIWELEVGPIPDGLCVGYKDGDPFNLTLSNLFLQTHARSVRLNGAKKRDLPTGVTLLPSGRYASRVHTDGVQYHIGTYDTPEEASIAFNSIKTLLVKKENKIFQK